MKKIVLLCAAGMSTSILVKKMREAAAEEGFDCTVDAFSINEAAKEASDADVVLLGPQVRFNLKRVQELLEPVPVDTIAMRDYGTMNATNVLIQARKMMGAE